MDFVFPAHCFFWASRKQLPKRLAHAQAVAHAVGEASIVLAPLAVQQLSTGMAIDLLTRAVVP